MAKNKLSNSNISLAELKLQIQDVATFDLKTEHTF